MQFWSGKDGYAKWWEVYKLLAFVPAPCVGKIEKLVWWESTVMLLIIMYVAIVLVPAVHYI